ncbi:hypothetical protein M885DRAFT_617721 [Pelagophyceae sp. CCMP2097]|nr:hypothetical protein M885DRAFT_617721 [Pelagophyceae sp. CCMP2097]
MADAGAEAALHHMERANRALRQRQRLLEADLVEAQLQLLQSDEQWRKRFAAACGADSAALTAQLDEARVALREATDGAGRTEARLRATNDRLRGERVDAGRRLHDLGLRLEIAEHKAASEHAATSDAAVGFQAALRRERATRADGAEARRRERASLDGLRAAAKRNVADARRRAAESAAAAANAEKLPDDVAAFDAVPFPFDALDDIFGAPPPRSADDERRRQAPPRRGAADEPFAARGARGRDTISSASSSSLSLSGSDEPEAQPHDRATQ